MFQFNLSKDLAKLFVYGIYFISAVVGAFLSKKKAIFTGVEYALLLTIGLALHPSIDMMSVYILWGCVLSGTILGAFFH
ncbi:hypothetical protein P261_00419 [Lachnospiraceae bacterium TWA4]|nr:hypothetical protein P261_00419 [Lachnospiraceae bacterium TWA4]